MIEQFFLTDEDGKKIIAIGRVKNTDLKYAMYMGGKIIMWEGGVEFD